MALLTGNDMFRRLKQRKHFLADGAMGTELMKRGIAMNRILAANLEHPETVLAVHQRYLRAGAGVIAANTFGVPAGDEFEEAIRAGVKIARQAAKEWFYPIGVWASFTPQTVVEKHDVLRRLASALPTALLIETCVSVQEATEALRVARELKPRLLAVTCHIHSDGTLPDGKPLSEAALTMLTEGANVVGANCGETPASFVGIARQLRSVTSAPLLMQPSAGIPTQNERGEWDYPVQPPVWATVGKALFHEGVNIVGGCCGTSPLHIMALSGKSDRMSGQDWE